MARSKISPEETDIEVGSTPAPSTSLATQAQGQVDAYDPNQYDDTSRDTETPVLGLVNNVGELVRRFRNKSGNFALGELLLGEKVTVIPTALVKFYRETVRDGQELKHGSPEAATAKVFATASEAAKAGYRVDFGSFPNKVEEQARIGYLVLAPEGDDSGEFTLKAPGGLRFSTAKCSYHRGGYRNVFQTVFDHAVKQARLKDVPVKGLNHTQVFKAAQAWTHFWTLSAETVTGKKNEWWEPRIARGAALSPEVYAWVTQEYGNLSA